MKSSAQLEQETEEARVRVNNTLEELRARTTPGQLVDQVIDYARDSSGGEFFSNLSRQVVNNPMPVVLLGASVAWLAFGQARNSGRFDAERASGLATPAQDLRRTARGAMTHASEAADNLADSAASSVSDLGDTAASRASDLGDAARDAAGDLGDRAEESADAVRDGVRQAGARFSAAAQSASDKIDQIRERASGAYGRAAESARRATSSVGTATTEARERAADLSRNFVSLCKEQPILVAGIGLALGATLGALFPASAAENRLMGAASDDVKERARRLSTKVKEGAQSVYGEATESAGSVMEPNRTASSLAEMGHS